jgi:hypothetical protein
MKAGDDMGDDMGDDQKSGRVFVRKLAVDMVNRVSAQAG